MHAVFILDKPMSKYFRVSFEGENPRLTPARLRQPDLRRWQHAFYEGKFQAQICKLDSAISESILPILSIAIE